MTSSIRSRDLIPMVDYANQLASERFHAGYDISEVQCAFNVLEEVLWERVVKQVSSTELAEATGLLTTVLGAGNDALARTYVSLASKQHVSSLDLGALFQVKGMILTAPGARGGVADRFAVRRSGPAVVLRY